DLGGGDVHSGDRAEDLPEYGRAREQGCRVPVDTEAEEHDVEAWELATARSEGLGERRRVRGRGPVAVGVLGTHPEDLGRRNWDTRQERLVRHPIVRFGVIGRHGALVAEEDPRSVP